jgi:ribonuclease HI
MNQPQVLDEVVVFFDGGARGNPGPAAIGAIVIDPSTVPPRRLATISERIGISTNNIAEYRALIAGLEAAANVHARTVRVRGDSKLVIEQLAGRWRVKHPNLQPLYSKARALLDAYERVDLGHVRREQNRDADTLVNAALDLP